MKVVLLCQRSRHKVVPREGLEPTLPFGKRILSHPDRGKVRNTTECPSPIFLDFQIASVLCFLEGAIRKRGLYLFPFFENHPSLFITSLETLLL